MKNHAKKAPIAWLLAMAMLVSLLPTAALAAGDETAGAEGLLASATYVDSDGYTETTTYTYDADGNLLTETSQDSDGTTYAYTYNADGNLLTGAYKTGDGYTNTTAYTYDDSGNLLTEKYKDSENYAAITTYTYDADGNLLTEISEDNEDWSYAAAYTYDATGNLLTETYTYSDEYGESTGQTTYTYDADGNLLTESYTYSDEYGESTSQTTYTYDANGNLLTESYTYSDEYGESTSQTTYAYDDDGNLSTETYADSDGYTDTTTYTYDAIGNLLTEDYVDSDGWFSHHVCTYDDDGNTQTETYEDSDGDFWSCIYAYTVEEFSIQVDIALQNSDGADTTATYILTIDADGNPLTGTYEDSDGNQYTVTYTYYGADEAGGSFADVAANTDGNSWYYDAVYWAYSLGVTKGTSATAFSPDDGCSRAQFVTFLYRLAQASGEDVSCKIESSPFDDVIEGEIDSDYYAAILWAYDQGITKGTSDTTFDPDETITRAQAVTMLYRYAGEPEVTGSSPFDDVIEGETDSDYYAAILWACDLGITNGNSAEGKRFDCDVTCSRAMMVTFLYRYAVL